MRLLYRFEHIRTIYTMCRCVLEIAYLHVYQINDSRIYRRDNFPKTSKCISTPIVILESIMHPLSLFDIADNIYYSKRTKGICRVLGSLLRPYYNISIRRVFSFLFAHIVKERVLIILVPEPFPVHLYPPILGNSSSHGWFAPTVLISE